MSVNSDKATAGYFKSRSIFVARKGTNGWGKAGLNGAGAID